MSNVDKLFIETICSIWMSLKCTGFKRIKHIFEYCWYYANIFKYIGYFKLTQAHHKKWPFSYRGFYRSIAIGGDARRQLQRQILLCLVDGFLKLLRVMYFLPIYLENHLTGSKKSLAGGRASAQDPGDDQVARFVHLHCQALCKNGPVKINFVSVGRDRVCHSIHLENNRLFCCLIHFSSQILTIYLVYEDLNVNKPDGTE